jgi:hypothetical protein
MMQAAGRISRNNLRIRSEKANWQDQAAVIGAMNRHMESEGLAFTVFSRCDVRPAIKASAGRVIRKDRGGIRVHKHDRDRLRSKQRDDAGTIGASNRRPEGKVRLCRRMSHDSRIRMARLRANMISAAARRKCPERRSWCRRVAQELGAHGMQIAGTSERRNRISDARFSG